MASLWNWHLNLASGRFYEGKEQLPGGSASRERPYPRSLAGLMINLCSDATPAALSILNAPACHCLSCAYTQSYGCTLPQISLPDYNTASKNSYANRNKNTVQGRTPSTTISYHSPWLLCHRTTAHVKHMPCRHAECNTQCFKAQQAWKGWSRRGGDNRRTVAWRKLLFTRSCCKKIQVWIAGMNTKWQVIATWLSYLHFLFQHSSRSHLLKKNRLTERNMSH